MLIAFSGLDGSGKTTHSRFAERYIRDLGYRCGYRHAIKDTLHYYILHRIVGNISGRTKTALEEGIRGKAGSAGAFWFSSLKKLFLFIDIIYFNLRYRSYKGKNDKNIVCDRYFYDETIQTDYLKISGRRFSDMYKKLIPQPDITFFLKVDPDVAFDRKKEYDMGYFSEKQKAYEVLNELVNVKEIDEEDMEAVKRTIRTDLERLYSVTGELGKI